MDARLARRVRVVYLLPAPLLYGFCAEGTKRVINTKPARKGQGYGGKGYREGWSIPLRGLNQHVGAEVGFLSVVSHGLSFSVTVRCAGGTQRYL